jgi:uracil-DNA glycosylase
MTDIAIVGEAYGEQEERARMPFVGASGYELTRMLDEAGIRRADCFLTNVFNLRPERNDVESLCGPKVDSISGLPAIKNGKYVLAKYSREIVRLLDELSSVRPNLIIALGNTATWALLHNTGISKIRGTVTTTPFSIGGGFLKVLPTYHPAAVLRDWSLRPVTVLDLAKAGRESTFPEIRRPKTWVHYPESLDDLESFYEQHLVNAPYIAFDIETSGSQITCVGFAPSEEIALVVPFVDNRVIDGDRGSFWRTLREESLAWQFVRRVLDLPCPKFGQNTLYDIHFLWRGYGITVRNYVDDTMLLHHALQPESNKGLGFLGSVYTNRSSWKTMRTKVLTISKEK